MKKQTKTSTLLYQISIFWKNKSSFLTLFLVIALPLFILSGIIAQYTYSNIVSSIIHVIIYAIVSFFILSFIVLHKSSGQNKISFSKILKLIPLILPRIFISVLLFSIAIVVAKYYFVAITIALFGFFPVAGSMMLFKQGIELKDIKKANAEFRKTEAGKKQILFLIVSFIIFGITLSMLVPFTRGIFSLLPGNLYFIITSAFIGLLYLLAFSILYFVSVKIYADTHFTLSHKVFKRVQDILSERKNPKRKKRSSKDDDKSIITETKHIHKEEKPFFEKEKKQYSKEDRNRFTNDEGFNRFEDTKF